MIRPLLTSYSTCFGDWVDRLNYVFTPFLFLFCAIIAAVYQFIGKPLNCWTPAHFNEQQIRYTEDYCWESNEWYTLNVTPISPALEEYDVTFLNLYKWMPAALLLAGFLFCLPMWGLKLLIRSFGLNINLLKNTMDNEACTLNSESFIKTAKCAAHQIGLYLDTKNKQRSFPCPMRCRVIICLMYVGTKLDYIFISLVVFVGLTLISSFSFLANAMKFFNGLSVGQIWGTFYLLDRRILCDMSVYALWNKTTDSEAVSHNYTIECNVSIINLYEKFFVIFWIWLALLALLNFFNFWVWMTRSVCCSRSVNFINRMLEAAEENKISQNGRLLAVDQNRQKVESFVNNYLKCDGRFIITLLLETCNPLLVYQVVAELFRMCNEPAETQLMQTTAFAAEIGLATSQKTTAQPPSGSVSGSVEFSKRSGPSASRPTFAQQEPAFDMAGHPPSYRYD